MARVESGILRNAGEIKIILSFFNISSSFV